MCLIALAVAPPGPWLLAMAANRDEFHDRPAVAAGWWSGAERPILAGRDIQAGGTWLGLRRASVDGSLRIAALTNLRPGLMPVAPTSQADQAARSPAPLPSAVLPSRGRLVADFLTSSKDPEDFLAHLEPPPGSYAGFNLLTIAMRPGAGPDAWYLNNLPGSRPRRLADGLHVLSNATLDVEWPKTRRLGHAISRVFDADVERASGSREAEDGAERFGRALLQALSDRTPADDADLPQTGLDRQRERLLSAPFIVDDHYGTRCSTVLVVARDGRVFFAERSFGPGGRCVGTVVEHFMRSGPDAPEQVDTPTSSVL